MLVNVDTELEKRETLTPKIAEDQEFLKYLPFRTLKQQIWFEFYYIAFTISACLTLLFLLTNDYIGVFSNFKIYYFSLIAGFIGGWANVTKWFYRTTARGKHNQYPAKYESHKFFWRILTPFLSSIIAFTMYIIVSSEIIPVIKIDIISKKTAFGVSFLFGFFSDFSVGKMTEWVSSVLGKKNDN